jgi:hypothetical protein
MLYVMYWMLPGMAFNDGQSLGSVFNGLMWSALGAVLVVFSVVGHAFVRTFVASRVGIFSNRLIIWTLGGYTPNQNIQQNLWVISLSGTSFNIMLTALFGLVMHISDASGICSVHHFVSVMFYHNAAMVFYNLLTPVHPIDISFGAVAFAAEKFTAIKAANVFMVWSTVIVLVGISAGLFIQPFFAVGAPVAFLVFFENMNTYLGLGTNSLHEHPLYGRYCQGS